MSDRTSDEGVALCPNCAESLPKGVKKCPACGYQIGEPDLEAERPTLTPLEAMALDRSGELPQQRPSTEPPASNPEPSQQVSRPSVDDGEPFDDDQAGISPDPLIGMVIAGRYRIVELIGRGGMGVVYKVEHTEIGKLLALKLLAGEISQQREVVKRFKREALLTSRLSHPNSVQVFDYGTSDGLTYLVMELVIGEDLATVIRKQGPLPAVRVAKIVIQVCSALAEAHALGIVHRDIKPENILLSSVRDEFEMVKVLDFGLAKLRESSELNGVTGTGQIIGTPYYMAPEQIQGTDVDSRTDIYALGAVMYEAITGKQVFRARTPMGVLTRHLTSQPAPFREVMNTSPPPADVERIVMRCLAKDPAQRYQSVEQLQEALVGFLHGLGLSGIDALLSNEELARLQASLGRSESEARGRDDGATHGKRIATRDEVEEFHRKLARDRWLTIGGVVLFLAGVIGGGVHYLTRPKPAPVFTGYEVEPNDRSAQATRVPFGKTVRGKIGKRLERDVGDKDFYETTVPPGVDVVQLNNTGLPNMAVCTWLFLQGQSEPLGRYCPAAPGKALEIAALRVQPGKTYWLLVQQDRAKRFETTRPMLIENVSDDYVLQMKASERDPQSWEVEPNDTVRSATNVRLGQTVQGRFEWYGDIDVVCADAVSEEQRYRWVVRDAVKVPRSLGAVLEVLALQGPRRDVPFRVHSRANAKHRGESAQGEFVSPWNSSVQVLKPGQQACLKLKIVPDPWAGPRAPRTPPVSLEPWSVQLEHVVGEEKARKHTKHRRGKRSPTKGRHSNATR